MLVVKESAAHGRTKSVSTTGKASGIAPSRLVALQEDDKASSHGDKEGSVSEGSEEGGKLDVGPATFIDKSQRPIEDQRSGEQARCHLRPSWTGYQRLEDDRGCTSGSQVSREE